MMSACSMLLFSWGFFYQKWSGVNIVYKKMNNESEIQTRGYKF